MYNMKQTMKLMAGAAVMLLALVMTVMMTACSGGDDSVVDTPKPPVETPQQPAQTDNVVTLTANVGFDGGGTTRALTSEGKKTFAEGDRMAVIYTNTSGETVKAVSKELTAGDITTTGIPATDKKTASFTVTLTNPDNTKPIRYIYPAAMAKGTIATNATMDDESTVDFTKLIIQNGTLATLGSNLDLCTFDAASWTSGTLPEGTLTNQLAVLSLLLKNADGTNDLTASITSLTISDGTNSYTVYRWPEDAPIYVAIRHTENKDITVTATDGSKYYEKTLTGKTYERSNLYPLGWRMSQPLAVKHASESTFTKVTGGYKAQDGDILTGELADNYRISIADGATVTLSNVTINGEDKVVYKWAGITCEGNATIILSGTNTVRGFYNEYPGIYVPDDKTLTIQGSGSLTASSNGKGAGIGGGYDIACGNIVIEGGTITAMGGSEAAGIGSGYNSPYGSTIGSSTYKSCGNITISGGTVMATGGEFAAGIGSGYGGFCGDITISGGTVTPIAGFGCDNPIGAGLDGSCGTITINGVNISGGSDVPAHRTDYDNGNPDANSGETDNDGNWIWE
jgi:hypothetical protein